MLSVPNASNIIPSGFNFISNSHFIKKKSILKGCNDYSQKC
jgi:hypothetical protein